LLYTATKHKIVVFQNLVDWTKNLLILKSKCRLSCK